jgi:hypothetical protein
VRPDPGSLVQSQQPVVVQRLPRVASAGTCAPIYKTGEAGTCVNNRPCRGFGVRNKSGGVFCTCYGELGGCAEGERCDDRKLICVPEGETPFERAD